MENREWPLVTVFTLVYNTGKYVVQALESVKANGYPNIQHIIIDDFSTDGESVQLVEQWVNKNNYPCTFIKHEKNKGICKSLNEVLSLARGKYMVGVSDDLISDVYFEKTVSYLESKGDEYALLYCDGYIIDEFNNKQEKTYVESWNYDISKLPDESCFEDILIGNFIPPVGALYRVEYIKDAGGFDENIYFEDWDIHIKLLRKHKITKLNEPLASYRVRSDSVSRALNYKYYESLLMLAFSNFNYNSKVKAALKTKMIDWCEYYYKSGGDRVKLFADVLTKTKSLKIFVFLIFVLAGVPYSKAMKLVK